MLFILFMSLVYFTSTGQESMSLVLTEGSVIQVSRDSTRGYCVSNFSLDPDLFKSLMESIKREENLQVSSVVEVSNKEQTILSSFCISLSVMRGLDQATRVREEIKFRDIILPIFKFKNNLQ